ncbi:restriction endonuclease subunit S [Spongiibacter tropicus]|uniref:restriction endonuclease subunit S n=1 Tax=Spongiibacter tropicus TaxID=454602 RepID=UPI0003B450B5|nr:restriction endonuclease subunit S [Spongiibacter tropicus]
MSHWVTKKFKDVCVLQRGFDLPKNDRKSGDFPLVSSSGIIDFHDEAKVTGPGVVTGRSGSIGQVYFVEEDFWPLNTSLYIKEFHGNYPRFIYYLLESFDLGRYTSGAGVPTLNRNHVHDEDVLIPLDLDEQKRIVAILDQAFTDIDKARALTEQNLKNARELFESYLQQVFSQRGEGWVDVALAEITECISDGDHAPPPKSAEGIPFITISNIDKSTNTIDFSDTFKVPEQYFENLKETRVPKAGDVLYTVTGSFGIPVVVPSDRAFCFQRHIGLLRPLDSVDSRWLYYLLMSPIVFTQAESGATGTAQKTVSLKLLRNIHVPFMPLEQQKSIAENLDRIFENTKHLEGLYSSKLEALDELKKSLLQKAFSGELTNSSSEAAA